MLYFKEPRYVTTRSLCTAKSEDYDPQRTAKSENVMFTVPGNAFHNWPSRVE